MLRGRKIGLKKDASSGGYVGGARINEPQKEKTVTTFKENCECKSLTPCSVISATVFGLIKCGGRNAVAIRQSQGGGSTVGKKNAREAGGEGV